MPQYERKYNHKGRWEDVSESCSFGNRVLGKKTFQSEQSEAGARVSGVHPAVHDRSKISWF